MLLSVPAARAADPKKGVTVEEVEYKGWKHNLRISNGDAELIVTLDVGPRIISYKLTGGKNVFKEFEDQLGKSGEKDWQIRGGTRLWVGPEDVTRTYFPDNGPVKYAKVPPPDCHRRFSSPFAFTPAPEKEYGIQKELEVHLAPRRAAPFNSTTSSPTSPTSRPTWRRGCRR